MFVTPDGFSKAFSDSGVLQTPTASPDGRAAVWLEGSPDDSEVSTLWVQRDGEEPTQLITGKLGPPAWGSRCYPAQDSAWAATTPGRVLFHGLPARG